MRPFGTGEKTLCRQCKRYEKCQEEGVIEFHKNNRLKTLDGYILPQFWAKGRRIRKQLSLGCESLQKHLRAHYQKALRETPFPGVNEFESANKNLALDNINLGTPSSGNRIPGSEIGKRRFVDQKRRLPLYEETQPYIRLENYHYDHLDDRERKICEMREQQNLSFAVIAEKTNLKQTNVRQIYNRAKKRVLSDNAEIRRKYQHSGGSSSKVGPSKQYKLRKQNENGLSVKLWEILKEKAKLSQTLEGCNKGGVITDSPENRGELSKKFVGTSMEPQENLKALFFSSPSLGRTVSISLKGGRLKYEVFVSTKSRASSTRVHSERSCSADRHPSK